MPKTQTCARRPSWISLLLIGALLAFAVVALTAPTHADAKPPWKTTTPPPPPPPPPPVPPPPPPPPPAEPTPPGQSIYWGARIDGDVYGLGDAPWDYNSWNRFESTTVKKVSLLHFGQPAPWVQAFTRGPFDMATSRGAVPYMTMGSDSVSLASIAAGNYDASLTAWAQAAKTYGKPFMFRWNWEMNGTWYSWGSQAKSNPANYTAAWRHFHDVVRAAGATNVTWVWCPNVVWSTSTPLSSLYPGDAYVDWTCMDGYNFGTNPLKPTGWQSFSALMKPTYDQLQAIAPTKPVMIGEVGATESGGSKASWITDMLKTQLPVNFPKIKAVAWFNWNFPDPGGRWDWQVESSASGKAAFADGVASPYYATNTYGSLPALTKVAPPQ